MQDVTSRARNIKAISFDVDGVLTDGRITYTDDGRELKSFHVQDGAALKLLMQNDIHVAVITGRNSPMVTKRCAELGIQHVYQGNEEKDAAFDDFLRQANCTPENAAHVGDDLADISLFKRVGLAISVPDGNPAAQQHAHHVTAAAGGQGVAREVAQLLLQAQRRWRY